MEALPGEGGVNYVAHLNFKTFRVQPPPQVLRFSHGRGERETGDWWWTAHFHQKRDVWVRGSLVSVFIYKCLLLTVGFSVTVTIWPREVVSCHDFILCTVATFWATSLVGIYPGRASLSVIGWSGFPSGLGKSSEVEVSSIKLLQTPINQLIM